jgi:uncharacterized protein
MPARVVIDTNVFTAALLSGTGANRRVLRACLSGQAHPLMGAALFSEYEDFLARSALMEKSPLSAVERRQLLEAFLSVCEWVRIYFLWRPNLPDEADNYLVELAIAGGADAIVTNNIADVQRSGLSFPHLQILTPAQFLKTI